LWRVLGVRAGSGAGLVVVGRPGGAMLALRGRLAPVGRRGARLRARLGARGCRIGVKGARLGC